jgi:hypothetical protein
MCILGGCDYLPAHSSDHHIKGIGLKVRTALRKVYLQTNSATVDGMQVLEHAFEFGECAEVAQSIQAGPRRVRFFVFLFFVSRFIKKKSSGGRYAETVERAELAFAHQLVYDPRTGEFLPLTPYPAHYTPAELECAGVALPFPVARDVAEGRVHSRTLKDFTRIKFSTRTWYWIDLITGKRSDGPQLSEAQDAPEEVMAMAAAAAKDDFSPPESASRSSSPTFALVRPAKTALSEVATPSVTCPRPSSLFSPDITALFANATATPSLRKPIPLNTRPISNLFSIRRAPAAADNDDNDGGDDDDDDDDDVILMMPSLPPPPPPREEEPPSKRSKSDMVSAFIAAAKEHNKPDAAVALRFAPLRPPRSNTNNKTHLPIGL